MDLTPLLPFFFVFFSNFGRQRFLTGRRSRVVVQNTEGFFFGSFLENGTMVRLDPVFTGPTKHYFVRCARRLHSNAWRLWLGLGFQIDFKSKLKSTIHESFEIL
jgi:hypothetical protein